MSSIARDAPFPNRSDVVGQPSGISDRARAGWFDELVTGRALSLATWLVFAMFFFWVWLIGPVGALLSMPITVLIVAVLGHNEQTRWLATLLTRRGETQA